MVPPESGLPEEHADACAVAKLLWGRLDRARLHSGGRTPEAIYQQYCEENDCAMKPATVEEQRTTYLTAFLELLTYLRFRQQVGFRGARTAWELLGQGARRAMLTHTPSFSPSLLCELFKESGLGGPCIVNATMTDMVDDTKVRQSDMLQVAGSPLVVFGCISMQGPG